MITLIARNSQGASVEFKGITKSGALSNFKSEYSVKGWKFEYIDENGVELISKPFKAYIAANKYTKAFDFAYGETESSAIAAVKRKNSPDWKDCIVWAERTDLPY